MRPCKHTERKPGCHICDLYFTSQKHREYWDGPWEVRDKNHAVQVAEPGPLQKLGNFSESYKRWEAAGKPITLPDEVAKRWAQCEPCEFRDRDRNVCLICGCPLLEVGRLVRACTDAPAKLYMATETCPAKDVQGKPAPRWLPVVNP